MTEARARVLACGEAALLVDVGGDAGEATGRVMGLDAAVAAAGLPGVVECVPGLTTLLVEFDPLTVDAATLATELLRLTSNAAARQPVGHRFELPVCFDAELAPDVGDAAATAGMSADDLLGILCGAELRVALIGHLPGLPYLAGLPAVLDLPRRASARPRVSRGSIGLAARMACVYPQEAPGGWHIVGRTPARLVDPDADPPARLAPGDRVRLVAVDRTGFEALERLEDTGMPAMRRLA
jgi:KipI family sensor histidine kinase inhibitor